MTDSTTAKKLTGGIVAIVVLALCLFATTLALVWATVSVENNLFQTGVIDINLNDGKPVIQEHEFLFEPGMTVTKEFFIENNSTWSVYYKLYFDRVTGGLADWLQVTVKDGERVLYSGTANELTREKVAAADTLAVQEQKALTVSFYFPKDAGNTAMNRTLAFTLCADATQTKNNPNWLFE